MVWAYARRIVALVQHAKAVRNRSVGQLPRNAVSLGDFPPKIEPSVSERGSVRRPKPAAVAGLGNLGPESPWNGDGSVTHGYATTRATGRSPTTASAASGLSTSPVSVSAANANAPFARMRRN